MSVEPEVIVVPHPGREHDQFIALWPLLDHFEEIYEEDSESHAGQALGVWIRHHRAPREAS